MVLIGLVFFLLKFVGNGSPCCFVRKGSGKLLLWTLISSCGYSEFEVILESLRR